MTGVALCRRAALVEAWRGAEGDWLSVPVLHPTNEEHEDAGTPEVRSEREGAKAALCPAGAPLTPVAATARATRAIVLDISVQ